MPCKTLPLRATRCQLPYGQGAHRFTDKAQEAKLCQQLPPSCQSAGCWTPCLHSSSSKPNSGFPNTGKPFCFLVRKVPLLTQWCPVFKRNDDHKATLLSQNTFLSSWWVPVERGPSRGKMEQTKLSVLLSSDSFFHCLIEDMHYRVLLWHHNSTIAVTSPSASWPQPASKVLQKSSLQKHLLQKEPWTYWSPATHHIPSSL